ncbi:hypothetical protein O181_116300 [Austropuccinia psidii MF-1]|uniref:Uncharacterized protein n=1 Tax=Austropuccinia psidii MF-1 TaxID=1389203 RepID=A0A9Q3K847_9BASI|nr:hypothetical protein [Austropuccinia psidii MF-1]
MEDARNYTGSKKLASTFEALIESPEAEITAIPIFRTEPFTTGNNRDIPVSVQELVYGRKAEGVGTSAKSLDRHNEIISSSEEAHGPRKDREPSEWFDTHLLQRTGPTDTSLVEKPKHFVRGPEEEVGPRKGEQRCGSSSSLHKKESASKSAKKDKQAPKSNQKGKLKAKGKAKFKWNRPYPQNYRTPKKEKTAMDNVFNMERTLMELKKKEEERMNQSFPKK